MGWQTPTGTHPRSTRHAHFYTRSPTRLHAPPRLALTRQVPARRLRAQPPPPHTHTYTQTHTHYLSRLTLANASLISLPPSITQGIIANLTCAGWTHHSTTDDVHIFVLDDPSAPPLTASSRPGFSPSSTRTDYFGAMQSSASLGSRLSQHGRGAGARSPAVARGGLRANESITVRGEGWIEGAWNVDDVAGTVASLGARGICKSRGWRSPAGREEQV